MSGTQKRLYVYFEARRRHWLPGWLPFAYRRVWAATVRNRREALLLANQMTDRGARNVRALEVLAEPGSTR